MANISTTTRLPISSTEEPAICVEGGSGLLLPWWFIRDSEQTWPRGLRVVIYLLFLFWCFIGVAIIADVFMAAIEKVTSKKLRRFDKEKQRYYTFELWNPTVANLTLMALGSSAPEILLNVIDIFAKGFFLEGLGPSTIVGSAAFNLLIILAVCIVAIPEKEIRKIEQMPVYVCTAVWSVFAYVWVLIILMGISPNVVEVWEGVLTFLFFPILCFLAWLCDKGYIGGGSGGGGGKSVSDMSDEELAAAQQEVRQKHGDQITPDQIARILTHTHFQKQSKRAIHRIGATRQMFGGKRVKMPVVKSLTQQMSFLGNKVMPGDDGEHPKTTFEFASAEYAVLESAGSIMLEVKRAGDGADMAFVEWETIEATANAGKDYVAANGKLVFEPGQASASIEVKIVDDVEWEETQHFFIKLKNPSVQDKEKIAELASTWQATVHIIDNDDAGVISFETGDIQCHQKAEDYKLSVTVKRDQGAVGEVSVKYRTEEDSAKGDRDFAMCDGTLTFADGQLFADIEVEIKGHARFEVTDLFRIFLEEPTNGAKINHETDGGEEKEICTVTINAEEGAKERVAAIKNEVAVIWDKAKVGHMNWLEQFKEAVAVNGGDPDEPPSMFDYVMHGIALPWKLLFACVPPTDYCGGWLCFCVALGMVGGVTVLIGDAASLLGCVMCIPEEITAITFVALGTSLPDTFASKSAAEQDASADAAVGNVTGSNSVNVFLGLGLPWMIAAFSWTGGGTNDKWQSSFQHAYPDELSFLGPMGQREQAFVVMAGSLGLSVAIFSGCAVLGLLLLQVRRVAVGGELGGPVALKWISAGILVALWLIYVGASSAISLSKNGAGCAA